MLCRKPRRQVFSRRGPYINTIKLSNPLVIYSASYLFPNLSFALGSELFLNLIPIKILT